MEKETSPWIGRLSGLGWVAAVISILALSAIHGASANRLWLVFAVVAFLLGAGSTFLAYREHAGRRWLVLGGLLIVSPAWGSLVAPWVSCALGTVGAMSCSLGAH